MLRIEVILCATFSEKARCVDDKDFTLPCSGFGTTQDDDRRCQTGAIKDVRG